MERTFTPNAPHMPAPSPQPPAARLAMPVAHAPDKIEYA
jgi:hypothetical protein